MTSTQEELIRYRIEKRMAGRRDVLLHVLVYALVLLGVFVNVPWWDARARFFFAAFWSIPLLLQCLRYYWQNGPGAKKRAQEIERETEAIMELMERQLGLTALDEEEATLLEERLVQRINARRWLGTHILTFALTMPLIWLEAQSRFPSDFENLNLVRQTSFWGAACFLHCLRFFLVHGRTAAGRALKIEKEVERQWHLSLSHRRERRNALDRQAGYDGAAQDDALLALGAARISAEGELVAGSFDEPPGEGGSFHRARA